MIPMRNFKRFFFKALRQPVYALKVFCKRLTAYVHYRSGSGWSSPPESVTLFLTHRCNLRCKMCGQWGEGGISKTAGQEFIKKEMSLPQLKAVVDSVSAFKPSVTLFGGEPLLFPGCVELIGYIKSKGMHCLMITNGSLLKRCAREIVDSGLDELNLSLDGGQELHDGIRGMQGLFSMIAEGIEKVNYYKAVSGSAKPLINLQCTITKYNYRQLEQLVEVAEKLKANSLTFHNLIFLDKDIIQAQKNIDESLGCSSKDWEGFVAEPGIDSDELYAVISAVRSKSYKFNVDFYPNFGRDELGRYYNDTKFSPGKCGCLSPWIVAYIFPDGEVRPCLNSDYSFGNVNTESFKKIWNSARAVKYRRTLKKTGIFPVCVRCTELYRY